MGNTNSSEDKHGAMLALLVSSVCKEIIEHENISENEALTRLYGSELYAALEDEATKLWHLSPRMLYQLYREERETGAITYPEEA